MKIMNKKIFLIESLVKRIKKNNLKEVIIATSATVEGQTTAHYIEDTIKNDKLKITKLAQGYQLVEKLNNLMMVLYFQLLRIEFLLQEVN